ncbi:hypothetical protein, partial [Roseateles chitinivorans]|uniref:hypothetical protein n=1 Tax=Roseateles chitinivorans TaxID=2917965 RepID=UPI001E65750A
MPTVHVHVIFMHIPFDDLEHCWPHDITEARHRTACPRFPFVSEAHRAQQTATIAVAASAVRRTSVIQIDRIALRRRAFPSGSGGWAGL